jgi:hypothetical protein
VLTGVSNAISSTIYSYNTRSIFCNTSKEIDRLRARKQHFKLVAKDEEEKVKDILKKNESLEEKIKVRCLSNSITYIPPSGERPQDIEYD